VGYWEGGFRSKGNKGAIPLSFSFSTPMTKGTTTHLYNVH